MYRLSSFRRTLKASLLIKTQLEKQVNVLSKLMDLDANKTITQDEVQEVHPSCAYNQIHTHLNAAFYDAHEPNQVMHATNLHMAAA